MKDSLDLIHSYPTWVKIAVLVLFASIVVLLVFFRSPAPPVGHEASFSEKDRKRLVASLHEYTKSGAHTAQIEFSSLREQATAKLLKGCFDAAGWTTDISNVPLVTGPQAAVVGYLVGVKVKSVNLHLVTSIASDLSEAGLHGVASEVISTSISRDNPKWPHINHRVQIVIGHEE